MTNNTNNTAIPIHACACCGRTNPIAIGNVDLANSCRYTYIPGCNERQVCHNDRKVEGDDGGNDGLDVSGTREWSEASKNICVGCENRCPYCFGRYDHEDRFHRPGEWGTMRVDTKKIGKLTRTKVDGVIMYPTSHDITPTILDPFIRGLVPLLRYGNKVMVTSKARPDCIRAICEAARPYPGQLAIRVTIGSSRQEDLTLWEPHAPTLNDRIAALEIAHAAEVPTSVSVEPFLNVETGPELLRMVKPFVTNAVWFGPMVQVMNRVRPTTPELIAACEAMVAVQTPAVYAALYEQLGGDPQVAWKHAARVLIAKGSGIPFEDLPRGPDAFARCI